eukprot:gene1421-15842_t
MEGDILANPTMFKEIKRIDKRSRKRGHKGSLLAYLKGEDDKCKEDCLVTVQLSIFALQYAVAKFLKTSASIIPKAIGGHSLGDITAACVAGIIKVKKAVDVIMARASLQDECKSLGAMAAIDYRCSRFRRCSDFAAQESTSIIAYEKLHLTLPKKGEEKRLQHLYAQTIGQMYTLEYDISFNLLQDQRQGKFIRFPNYPWQEVDLWVKNEFLIRKLSMNMLGVSEIVTSEILCLLLGSKTKQ